MKDLRNIPYMQSVTLDVLLHWIQ